MKASTFFELAQEISKTTSNEAITKAIVASGMRVIVEGDIEIDSNQKSIISNVLIDYCDSTSAGTYSDYLSRIKSLTEINHSRLEEDGVSNPVAYLVDILTSIPPTGNNGDFNSILEYVDNTEDILEWNNIISEKCLEYLDEAYLKETSKN